MKQECKNCVKWSKCSGTKKDKNERGVCKFLNSCIYYTWEQEEEPERDKNNKSLIINDGSTIDGKIGHLRISSTSKELIHRHVYIWTDAGFCCSNYEPKTA